MALFLGVDGGQSSTTALIGDEQGRVLGYGRSGPCNHVKTGDGRAKFLHALQGCLSAAAQQASLPAANIRFSGACLGFSGGPADKQTLVEELVCAEHLLVTHDALIGLVGATAGEPGIIIIAGTGTMAFGRNAAGRSARAGGWGYVFGDEGGAFDIARQGLRAALRFEEGWGLRTRLHPLLLEATGASDANDLLHRFYTSDFPRPRIASYARLVDQAAEEGDVAAREILLYAAQQLAGFTGHVRRQLFREEEPVRIAPLGGVYRSRLLHEHFRMLVQLDEQVQFGPPLHGPAAGALLEAYRVAGVCVNLTGLPEEKQ